MESVPQTVRNLQVLCRAFLVLSSSDDDSRHAYRCERYLCRRILWLCELPVYQLSDLPNADVAMLGDMIAVWGGMSYSEPEEA
jgi:hypothetical protein